MTFQGRQAAFFFGAVVVRLAFHFLTGFTADDALITFRYAENIAATGQFVYNTGEHVLGTTTPLFTLILAIVRLIGIKPLITAMAVSLLSSGWTAVLLYRFSRSLRFGRWDFVAPLAFILWPRTLPADISGMETALFTALVLTAFWYLHNRVPYYALASATLATLVRPEGLLCLAVVLAKVIIEDPRDWKRYLAVPMTLIIPWLGFALFYFGSFIPHSATAKLALYGGIASTTPWDSLGLLLGWRNPLGWLHTALAIVGSYWLIKKQNYGRPELIWLLLFILFLSNTGTPVFFWYFVPANPLYLLLAAAVLPMMQSQFEQIKDRFNLFAPAVAVSLSLVLLISVYIKVVQYTHAQKYNHNVLRAVGEYLNTHADREREIVAAEDIGYIGYFSEMPLLDRDGLVSPVAAQYNGEGRYLDLIMDTKPDWVGAAYGSPISGFIDQASFHKMYTLAETWSLDQAEYRLYRRNDQITGQGDR